MMSGKRVYVVLAVCCLPFVHEETGKTSTLGVLPSGIGKERERLADGSSSAWLTSRVGIRLEKVVRGLPLAAGKDFLHILKRAAISSGGLPMRSAPMTAKEVHAGQPCLPRRRPRRKW
ncbi:unnamed protein product [Phaeothamnion confervicola]